MDSINQILGQLQLDIRSPLTPDQQASLNIPFPFKNIILYTPVSYYDEMGVSPLRLEVDTLLDLIQNVLDNYQIEVPPATLEYYATERPGTYDHLSPPIKLYQLVGGRYYIESITSAARMDKTQTLPQFMLDLIF